MNNSVIVQRFIVVGTLALILRTASVNAQHISPEASLSSSLNQEVTKAVADSEKQITDKMDEIIEHTDISPTPQEQGEQPVREIQERADRIVVNQSAIVDTNTGENSMSGNVSSGSVDVNVHMEADFSTNNTVITHTVREYYYVQAPSPTASPTPPPAQVSQRLPVTWPSPVYQAPAAKEQNDREEQLVGVVLSSREGGTESSVIAEISQYFIAFFLGLFLSFRRINRRLWEL